MAESSLKNTIKGAERPLKKRKKSKQFYFSRDNAARNVMSGDFHSGDTSN